MSSTMDIPLNRPQYQQNLPHSIQEKLSLFSVFENLIANLEAQLQSMKKEHSKLKVDVEPYRIQDKPDAPVVTIGNIPKASKSPISRCPNEILYLVFQQYLVGDHREIGKLLSVCKHWNFIVMNSPGLWARIEIHDAKEFFRPSKQSSAISYISACYLRSCNILLDVSLSLEDTPYHSGYIACQVEDCVAQIVDEKEEEDIIMQISDIEWDYTPHDFDKVFQKFAECIFGIDGSYLVRWASLHLHLPSEINAAIEIWKGISFALPNLKELSIDYIPTDVLPPSRFAALRIPSVESLTVGSETLPAPLDVFQISWDRLTYLMLDFDRRLQNIESISLLTSLQTLELFGVVRYYTGDNTWVPPDPSTWPIYSIQLLRLTKLILRAHYEPLEAIQFHLPRLDKLTVYSLNTFKKLPILSPPHIQWQFHVVWEGDWKPKAIHAALNSLVALSPVSITIPQSARVMGLSTSASGRRKQDASMPAIQLYAEHKDGDIEQLSEEETKRLLTLAKTY